MPSTDRYDACRKLVEKAGEQAVKAFKQHRSRVQIKADNSYVTETDLAIESMLIKSIKDQFPDDHIISEEAGDIGHQSAYTWHLDPLDGTTNFLFGMPVFGSMISLTYQDEVVAAAVALPTMDLVISAGENTPTHVNGNVYHLFPAPQLKEVTIITESGKSAMARQESENYLVHHAQEFRSIRRFGCVASHTAALSTGQPFLSMLINAPSHDVMPLAFLFHQAGLLTVNRQGSPWTTADHDLISFHPDLKNVILPTLTHLTP